MDDNHQTNEATEGFSSDWLRLREPADHEARSASLTKKLVDWRKTHTEFNVVDLGSGTASNLRYLCPRLGMNQSWTLIDNDKGLLSCIEERLASWAIDSDIEYRKTSTSSALLKHTDFNASVSWQRCDLAKEIDTINFDNVQLITGSALLDLTSAVWMKKLADIINQQQCASLFVLSYNGKIQWLPEKLLDEKVTELLNIHQLNDKGFGHALGPGAFEYFKTQLINASIETSPTDWLLGKNATKMQETLIEDWTKATIEQSPRFMHELEEWSSYRLMHLLSGESSLQVGHVDVLSLPLTTNDVE